VESKICAEKTCFCSAAGFESVLAYARSDGHDVARAKFFDYVHPNTSSWLTAHDW